MAKSSPLPAERAFTLIELLVVIAIIIILAGIAIPALTSALERAKIAKDMSNLRQIGTATQMYMNDNNGVFPGSATLTWMSQLEQNQKYLSAWRVCNRLLISEHPRKRAPEVQCLRPATGSTLTSIRA